MTAFLNNIIIFFSPFFAPTQWRRRIERVQMRRVIVSAAWGGWTEGEHENGGDRFECVICRLFNTVVQAILCAHRVSPTPLSRSSAPRDPWRHSNTVSSTKITDADYVLCIIQAYYIGILFSWYKLYRYRCVFVCMWRRVNTEHLFILFFCKS